jgi:hypothetical protein
MGGEGGGEGDGEEKVEEIAALRRETSTRLLGMIRAIRICASGWCCVAVEKLAFGVWSVGCWVSGMGFGGRDD